MSASGGGGRIGRTVITQKLFLRDTQTGESYLLGVPSGSGYDISAAAGDSAIKDRDVPLWVPFTLQLPAPDVCDARGLVLRVDAENKRFFVWAVSNPAEITSEQVDWQPAATFQAALSATLNGFRTHIRGCPRCRAAPKPGAGNVSDAVMCGNCGDVLWAGTVRPSEDVCHKIVETHAETCGGGWSDA